MRRFCALLLMAAFAASLPAEASDYVIDSAKAHASIQFRIKHLGYAWLYGRFNRFRGEFSYDEADPAKAKAQVEIDLASVDTNYAERDKHLRSPDFFEVAKFPRARFVSTGYRESGDGRGLLQGELTMHGVTRPVTIAVEKIGGGPDPWGGERRGFLGTARLTLADYGINFDLGPATREVELILSIEGYKK